MDVTKRAIASVLPGNDLYIERIRALIRLEDGSDTAQDY